MLKHKMQIHDPTFAFVVVGKRRLNSSQPKRLWIKKLRGVGRRILCFLILSFSVYFFIPLFFFLLPHLFQSGVHKVHVHGYQRLISRYNISVLNTLNKQKKLKALVQTHKKKEIVRISFFFLLMQTN